MIRVRDDEPLDDEPLDDEPLPSFFRPETMRRLHDELVLPPTTLGYLDWGTGFLRINCTVGEYRAWLAGSLDEERTRALNEVVFHEMLHFLQIITSAHLFAFVAMLNQILQQTLTGPDILFSVDSFPDRAPDHLEKRLSGLLAKLDLRGDEGVTVRALVESVAFFAQSLQHAKADLDDAKAYARHADRTAPAEEYALAFQVAHRHLGDGAMLLFAPLAHVALTTKEPWNAFAALCREAARRGMHRQHRLDLNLFQDVCNVAATESFGSPTDIIPQLSSRPATWADDAERIAQAEHRALFSTVALRPQQLDAADWVPFLPPIALNPEESETAREWPIVVPKRYGIDERDRKSNVGAGKLYSILSARILGNVMPYQLRTPLSSRD